jgi:hypothetical protein
MLIYTDRINYPTKKITFARLKTISNAIMITGYIIVEQDALHYVSPLSTSFTNEE